MSAKKTIERMIKERWLNSYRTILGVENTLIRIKKRLSNKRSNSFIVSEALEQLENNYDDLEEDFNEFFPEIIYYLKTQKKFL